MNWMGAAAFCLAHSAAWGLPADAAGRQCAADPDHECVIALALATARGIDDADSRAKTLRAAAQAQKDCGGHRGRVGNGAEY